MSRMRKSGINSGSRINKGTIKPSSHIACMPLKPDLRKRFEHVMFSIRTCTSLCCRRVSTELLGQAETSGWSRNGGVVEWNGMVSGEWWLVMEWWVGGCTRSCLCVSFSVGLVMISSLGYVGVHEDNHHHGRSCARASGFSIENAVRSLVFEHKIKVVPARKT